MNERMSVWMNEWMNEKMKKQMDEWIKDKNKMSEQPKNE